MKVTKLLNLLRKMTSQILNNAYPKSGTAAPLEYRCKSNIIIKLINL